MEVRHPMQQTVKLQFFFIISAVAHQLRYTAGTLYLEAAGNGYNFTLTPTFQVNGPIYAAVKGGVGIGTIKSRCL
ncbi:MAG: hypothetical protein MZV63_44785 [Marinilabiliales bacterium]|nr:hypothetical protein [Marinilabiliales bacterium]